MADASVSRAPQRVRVKWVAWVAASALIALPLIFNSLSLIQPERAATSPEVELSVPPRAESEHRKTPSPNNKAAKEQAALAKPDAAKAPKPAPSKPKLAAVTPGAIGPAETGRPSWYDLASATASGETMDEADLTAAHPSLPLGTKVLVENLDNGRSVVVRINDRGPFTHNRIIDVSKAAAEKLDMVADGVANVRVRRIEAIAAGIPAPR
jgi:rare lipoprotein A